MSTKNKRDNEGNNKNNENDKGQVDEGLNIDEMNKLRIKLGMKPLYVTPVVVEETKMEDEVPDPEITKQIKQELENKKNEREYKNALKGKKLGEEIEEESASSWISKMKKRALEKEAEFEQEEEKMDHYLMGRDDEKYRVFHDMSDINEGEDVILNLKDQNVMDEDDDEEVALVNDSINTKEKDRRNKELKKKKPVYNPYDEGKSILSQYDDEKGPSSFVIEGKEEEAEDRRRKIRESLKMEQEKQSKKEISNTGSKIASDYYNEEEMSKLFKPKKKKCNRKKNTEKEKSEGRNKRNQVLEMLKKQKQEEKQQEVKEEIKKEEGLKKEDEEEMTNKVEEEKMKSKPRESLRERERRYQRTVKKALSKASNQPIEDEINDELYETLSKSRKRKNVQQIQLESSVGNSSVMNVAEKILQSKLKQKQEKKERKEKEKGLTFTSTTEFVRGLEVEDFPEEEVRVKREKIEEEVKPIVQIKKEKDDQVVPSIVEKDEKMDESGDEGSDEDDNDVGGIGLASVLNMLKTKGEGKDDALLVASRFSDPTYIKKEIYTFEEDGIDLRKFDEFNRLLTPKEAFRDLSHRFHGKGSGKTKSEKRLRKYHQQLQMNRIQSTENKERILDNVLDYQKKSGKAYVQLTMGSNAMQELTKQTGDELSKKLEENLKKKTKKEGGSNSKKPNNK